MGATPIDTASRTKILLLLISLNLIFVLPFFMGIVGFLFGILAAGAGVAVGGAGVLLGLPIPFLVPGFVPGVLTTVSFGIGLISLGILIVLLGIVLTKLLYRGVSTFIAWNRKLVNG